MLFMNLSKINPKKINYRQLAESLILCRLLRLSRIRRVEIILLLVFFVLGIWLIKTFVDAKTFFSLLSELPEILGKNHPKTYLVLLQNDRELRPSGGFMGSYAKLKFEKGGLTEFSVQDIYVPDGRLVGHVAPPKPIEQAFKQGWWKLRDANWDADFPSAALAIEWFFQKGGEEKADGIIALNFSLFEEIIKILGPMKLLNYDQVVNEENLYQIVQAYSEVNFFPGSTQKKDILSALAEAFFEKMKNLNSRQIVSLGKIILNNLNQRQILVWFSNPNLQRTIKQIGWDGGMKKPLFDYLYIVETNLGANKANCCVERKVKHTVDLSDSTTIKEEVIIEFNNVSRLTTPQPPWFWGGNYINFLRIYLPSSAEKIKILIDSQEVKDEDILKEEKKDQGLQGVGFFVTVPALSQKKVKIDYQLPDKENEKYRLLIQKQPGIKSFSYNLKVISRKGKSLLIKKEIIKDEEISL